MDSILTSIKKLLGIAEEYEHFDPDIVMYINSAFSVRNGAFAVSRTKTVLAPRLERKEKALLNLMLLLMRIILKPITVRALNL